ncbi:MAG TPA: hypothetical protein PLQ11_04795 [Beijerinckiaceae bacterium]|nr:hypothetical protein [Beijerinckiaceae bacterium]
MVIRYASETGPDASEPKRIRPLAPVLAVDSLGLRLSGLARAALARLRRRLLAMILVAALPLAGAFAYLKVMPPVYLATASVFVDPAGGRPGRSDSPVDPAIIAAHLRQVTAKSTFQRAIDKDRLAEDSSIHARPTGMAALARIVLDLINRSQDNRSENRNETLLRVLAEQISARRSGEANLIEIVARSSDGDTAARLANAVAQAFVDEVVAGAGSVQGAERARAAALGDDALKKLREAEAKLADFRARNGIEPAGQGKPGAQDGDIAAQLTRARAASLEAKTRSDQIQKLLASGKDIEAIADLVRSPAIDRLRIQYNEAAAQEASFRTSLGPRHPSYLEAAEQARERRRLLMEGLRLAGSSARSDWQAARDQELALERRAGTDAPAQSAAAPAEPPALLRELERAVDLARLAYERTLKTQQSAESAPDQGAARVVTRASPSDEPSRIEAGVVWSRAGMASAGLSALVLLLGGGGKRSGPSGSVKPSRRSRTVPVRDMQVAGEMATPPADQTGAGRVTAEQVARGWAEVVERTFGAAPAGGAPASAPPPAEPPTASQAVAREIAARDGEFALQLVLVTADVPSPQQGEIALDLARASAQLDLRVLVVDANPGDQELSRRFAAAPCKGRLHLNGRDRPLLQAELGAASVAMVPNEQVRGLPANDASGTHIKSLAGHFDLVIINGAPLTDAAAVRALARTAQSIVVAMSNSAGPGQAQIAALLGTSASQVRIVPTGSPPAPPLDARNRPMAVVRLSQCA